MIDLHSHVLPGLDDGAADLSEALAICAAAAADGITTLAATPHVRQHDYPTTPDAMESAFDTLKAANPAVKVVKGGELDLAELERPKEELQRFALGGSRYLLVETPYYGWPLDLAERLFHVQVQGFKVVLAHPERNPDVFERPDLLEPIVAAGTLVQLTAASVDGRLGRQLRACAHNLIDRGLAHMIASDAHAPAIREIGMSSAAASLRDDNLARWLTNDVPAAVVADKDPPPRPMTRPRRRGLFGR